MVLRGDQFHLKGGIRDEQGCGVAIQPRLQLLGTAVVVAMEGQVVVAVSDLWNRLKAYVSPRELSDEQGNAGDLARRFDRPSTSRSGGFEP